MNVANGDMEASFPRNAEIKNTIAYGVQVKIKPHTVIIIPIQQIFEFFLK